MNSNLDTLFNAIDRPDASDRGPKYAAIKVTGYESYLIGKDQRERACLFVGTRANTGRAGIRLQHLDAQFDIDCEILDREGEITKGQFTVITCRSDDNGIIRYFLSICSVLIHTLGDEPTQEQVATGVERLASIFQHLANPPQKSINGLFGELFFILRSSNPRRALLAWRAEDDSRFDFSLGNCRIEVKTSSNRIRVHQFSYEQCNPPLGTVGIVVSLFAERMYSAITLRAVIDQIKRLVQFEEDLVWKIERVVANTLGNALEESLTVGFDMKLADESMAFFNILHIPAIRGELVVGVSGVHFRSDISGSGSLSAIEVTELDEAFGDLLPGLET